MGVVPGDPSVDVADQVGQVGAVDQRPIRLLALQQRLAELSLEAVLAGEEFGGGLRDRAGDDGCEFGPLVLRRSTSLELAVAQSPIDAHRDARADPFGDRCLGRVVGEAAEYSGAEGFNHDREPPPRPGKWSLFTIQGAVKGLLPDFLHGKGARIR